MCNRQKKSEILKSIEENTEKSVLFSLTGKRMMDLGMGFL